MPKQSKKNRPVTGFRLDPEILDLFQARLRAHGMAMQPTLEAWVKRWLESGEPFTEASVLSEVRKGQDELRTLVEALARKWEEDLSKRPRNGSGPDWEKERS